MEDTKKEDREFEIWKDIKGYEQSYQVSSWGNVKSLKRKICNGKDFFAIKEIILRYVIDKGGYKIVSLYKNSKKKNFKIHRLVALHFIPNPDNKSQVNHSYGNKLNNYYKDLEWSTNKENSQHAWNTGLCENVRKSRSKVIYCPELKQTFNSIRKAEIFLGINHSNISACCLGKRNFAGIHPNDSNIKLTWKYYN